MSLTLFLKLTPRARGLALGLCLGLASFFGAALASAQTPGPPALFVLEQVDEPIIITADEVIFDRPTNRLELIGHVVVVHPSYWLEADHAWADLGTRTIKAQGNVVVKKVIGTEAQEVLRADEIEIATDRQTGWMVRGRLTVPFEGQSFQFQGERFEKVDDHTYLIEHGSFTWCRCPEGEAPDWSVSADEIRADTRGDASFRGARINIRNHPVFLLPYFRFPVATGRRSGFLLPEIMTSSSSGFQIEIPYYRVLGRSADATVSLRYIEDRGLSPAGEFRYNFGDAARGETRGFGLDDREEHVERGGVRLIHRADFDNFSLAADVVYITDNEVVYDFNYRQLGDEFQRALESRVVASYHQPTMNLTAEFSAFDDLMGGDVRPSALGPDRDEQMVQRLPAIQYTLLTRPVVAPLLFDVQGFAVNYWRRDESRGRGQLLSVFPRLILPARIADAVDFWAAAGYREWFLVPDPEFDPQTTYTGRAEAELYASAQWERIYTTPERVFRHNVRPALVVYYGDKPEAPHDDFFRTIVPRRATELAGLRLDTRLWSRPVAKPGHIIESARLELTQLYDFEASEWRDLRLEGRLGQPTPWRVNLDLYYSWVDRDLSRLVGSVGYRFGGRAEVRLGYRFDSGHVHSPYFEFENAPDEAVTAAVTFKVLERSEFLYRAYYSLKYDRMIRQTLEWNYLARQQCWGLNVRIADRIRPLDPEGDHDVSGSVNLLVTAPGSP